MMAYRSDRRGAMPTSPLALRGRYFIGWLPRAQISIMARNNTIPLLRPKIRVQSTSYSPRNLQSVLLNIFAGESRQESCAYLTEESRYRT